MVITQAVALPSDPPNPARILPYHATSQRRSQVSKHFYIGAPLSTTMYPPTHTHTHTHTHKQPTHHKDQVPASQYLKSITREDTHLQTRTHIYADMHAQKQIHSCIMLLRMRTGMKVGIGRAIVRLWREDKS